MATYPGPVYAPTTPTFAARNKPMRWLLLALLALGAFPTLLVAQTTTQVVEFYHTDASGSVRAVTKQVTGTWQVVRRYDYMPFGEELAGQPLAAYKFLFTGKERDFETGQDYFGARYYGAGLGRFTTVDPELNLKDALADPQRWNRYAYVTNNPLRYIDPDGRDRMGMYQPGQRGEAAPWRGLWQEVKTIGAVAAGFVAPLFAPEVASAAVGCVLSPACQQNARELMAPPGTPATPRQAAFATEQLLVQHLEKHGAEFGVTTAKQYLSIASHFVESALTG